MTGNSYRDRIEAAVEAHRDIQRSLRQSMLDRDAAEQKRVHRRADPDVLQTGRRILRRANEIDESKEPEESTLPERPAVTPPRGQRPSRWLT